MKSCLHGDSFSLLTLRNILAHCLLVHPHFLKELRRSLGVVLPLDILESREIVHNSILLLTKRFAEVFAQWNERSTHDTVGNNLVIVCLEQEEDDAGCEDDVPLLYNIGMMSGFFYEPRL